jgi:formate hydrogenlyase transcriptional activator
MAQSVFTLHGRTPTNLAFTLPPIDRIQFEELLWDISAQLVAAPSERVGEAIQSVLDLIRHFFGADRCGLLMVSDNLETVRAVYASYSKGTRRVSTEIALTQLYPWTRQRVVIEREIVNLSSPNDLPLEATADRAAFAAMETQSLLVIPIEVGQKRLHLILISSVRERREWPEEYVPRLRLLGEMLVNTLERARALDDLKHLREKLENENVYLREEVKERLGAERIIGRSAAIRAPLALAEKVAATDSTVLLLGETGTGKERFATYIHERSRRHDRPMIRVNCSAIPTSLIESELFGREKGAYTGALSKQIGRFELAHGSTLFLDEIGELPTEMQVKLLRVLESHTIERLGNPKPISVDVRIIAATNRSLADALRDGRFRQDLYYRLNVFPISVPPLRDRREDIPLFIDAFIDELAESMGKRIEEVDSDSMEALAAYAWPGNVRELRNLVERAMIVATGPTLRLCPEIDRDEASSGNSMTSLERTRLLQVLQNTGWRIRGVHGASARLGLKPTTLESRIKRLGITRPGG